MRSLRTPLALPLLLVLVAVVAPALAVRGTVTDSEGRPLKDARVCYFQDETKVSMGCVQPQEDGTFELPDSKHMDLRVTLEGHYPEIVPAQGKHLVVLRHSPTLFVRLRDATNGEAIDSGEVFVVYPSAVKKGPFPTNKAGVRIGRILDPGEVFLLGRAQGYEESDPKPATLVPGEETTVDLELQPVDKNAER